ncbi:MAG TPA: hypothetical protein VK731_11250, partial [Candidatus Cybelea sp.]|nr:hypothetical protein [Candidatus Cybelea sp.]
NTSSNPHGMAFDGAGNLYVAYPYINTIEKFTPAGVGTVFTTFGLNHPENIAFDSLGNLYAANTGDNTITQFVPGGGSSLYASNGMNGPWFIAMKPGLNVFVTLTSALSSSNLVLSWPANAIGFQLQTATAITSPSGTNWIASTNSPTILAGQFTVTNAFVGPSQFFRLKR